MGVASTGLESVVNATAPGRGWIGVANKPSKRYISPPKLPLRYTKTPVALPARPKCLGDENGSLNQGRLIRRRFTATSWPIAGTTSNVLAGLGTDLQLLADPGDQSANALAGLGANIPRRGDAAVPHAGLPCGTRVDTDINY